ncbi:hypothetical protein G6F65_021198 [Rhizopus arrhizus]|nr:hypothetical protein G6F65_021198 [Rhizopus arrhizus]
MARADAGLASACAAACAEALSCAWPVDRRTRSCVGAALATPVSPGRATVPDAAAWPFTTDGLAPAAAPSRARYLANASACSLKIRRASAGSIARTVAASGIFSFCPARTKFILFWMNASGLARHSATSIWLSPDFTLTEPAVPPARAVVPTAACVTSAPVPRKGTSTLTCT